MGNQLICDPCAQAADIQATNREHNTKGQRRGRRQRGRDQHPIGCGCTCQHRPVGSIIIRSAR